MDEDGARFDSGFDDNGPFRVTPEAGGVSLESALRDYGPAAIDDLIPRLRAIARDLDAAHASGRVHGALHPSKVIVHDDATSLIAGSVAIAPYAAPETADGPATPASDQYAFAAVAYEWLFGRPIAHAADRPVDVRSMPGVDRVTLSKAFTRALSPNPSDRFASCTDFCSAIATAVAPSLPFDARGESELLAENTALLAFDAEEDPVGPFVPESVDETAVFVPEPDDVPLAQSGHTVDDIRLVDDAPLLTAPILGSDRDDAFPSRRDQPDLDTIAPPMTEPPAASVPTPVPSWNPSGSSTSMPSRETQRFGGTALIVATLVGALFGFAAGYMARPRALQSGVPQEVAITEPPVAGGPAAPVAPAAKPSDAPEAPVVRDAPAAAKLVGRLLVRSTPSGASVSVDGVEKGVTPLALRELANGTINVTVARRGYVPETHRVVITSARPARSLDVRLAAETAAPSAAPTGRPRAATPGTTAPPAASTATGVLNIDSRPSGAAVTVNGQPRGTTPLTLTDLSPGEYQVQMAMPGYRTFTTTVRVVAGERVRAAASLTALEQQ